MSKRSAGTDKNPPMAVLSPTTLDDALAALAEHPGAHVLAGGTDFMVEVNFGHRRPEDVVALARVDELRRWDIEGETVRLGAGVTCSQLMQPPLAESLPALAQAARTVGSPQIRNAATIGGNLGTGSPAGDLLPVLSALDAAIVMRSLNGSRVLSIHDFLVGPKRTALQPGELVTEVVVALPKGPQEFMKVGVRNAMVIAIANLALVVDRGGAESRGGLGRPHDHPSTRCGAVGRGQRRRERRPRRVRSTSRGRGQADRRPPVDRGIPAAGGRSHGSTRAAQGGGRVSEHYRLTINGEHA